MPISSDLPSSGVTKFITGGGLIFALAGAEFYMSSDNGNTWAPKVKDLKGTDISKIETIAADNSIIAVSTGNKGIYISTDQGVNWRLPAMGIIPNMYVMTLGTSGPNLVAAVLNSADIASTYCSTDRGETWKMAKGGDYVLSLSFSSLANVAIAGCEQGVALRSTDNGLNWTRTSPQVGPIRTTLVSGSTVCFGGSGKVATSSDTGSTWKSSKVGTSTASIIHLAASGNLMFAASTSEGMFVSTDKGTTWIERNGGLSTKNIQSVAISGENVLVLTKDAGLFKATISDFAGVVDAVTDGIEQETGLWVAPQPAYGTTTLHFRTACAGSVVCRVYDLFGRQCFSIDTGSHESGSHSLPIPIETLSPGLYCIQLQCNDTVLRTSLRVGR